MKGAEEAMCRRTERPDQHSYSVYGTAGRVLRTIPLWRGGVAGLVLGLLASVVSADGFVLNFEAHGNPAVGSPIPLGQTFGDSGGNDGTGFIQDIITIDGQQYFHVVIEDPNSDFRQESYTASVVQNWADRVGVRSFSPFAGGNERSIIGNNDVVDTSQNKVKNWPKIRFGNAKDPFGYKVYSSPQDKAGTVLPVDQRYRLSGNGTMDPSRVVMLMQMSDANVAVEYYKPALSRKPRISQTLTEGGVSARFVADMRGLDYQTLNQAAPVVNTFSLQDPDLPTPGAADFEMELSQKPHVTAGQYTFSPGSWNTAGGWDVPDSFFTPGTYTYSEGAGFDVLNVDWTRFFDPLQNPNSLVDLN